MENNECPDSAKSSGRRAVATRRHRRTESNAEQSGSSFPFNKDMGGSQKEMTEEKKPKASARKRNKRDSSTGHDL